jgi:endonuclease/exonuclease/phosphatase family metal-dependent hydrolase
MSFFYQFDPQDESGRRTAAGLLRLREKLAKELPARTISDTLMLATWNIREFDSNKYGDRTSESISYVAEIISHFDLVAVQEVNADLKALGWVQKVLGDWWKFLVTDVTAGKKGNQERMAFLYDSRKVKFGGLAGEIVIPPEKGAEQLARTPFVCGFETGWLKFMLCTVHIYYGTEKAEDPGRIKEIDLLSKFLADHVKQDAAWCKNLVLLGDFNIFSTSDATFTALTKAGFFIPPQLQQLPSNAERNKHYDQMAFVSHAYDPAVVKDRLERCKAGVFNFFESVYRDGNDDEAIYSAEMGHGYVKAKTPRDKTNYYRQWRTFHMSDHLPMWFELPIDFGKEYLERIAATKQ